MNEKGPSLLSRNLWTKRTSRFLAILERALQLLACQTGLEISEVALNRRLHFCLLQASRELYPAEECAPTSECNNQPDPGDEVRTRREDKRPDFQWMFLDRYEPDTDRSQMQFVVECKRLGVPSRADWILNANYVAHGVWRFVAPEWGYAKRFPSAAMVGYWQTMEAGEILREVNEAAAKHTLTALELGRNGWKKGSVSTLVHQFDRHIPISPFLLHHLWVDLRKTSLVRS
jgi:hypothetical protein